MGIEEGNHIKIEYAIDSGTTWKEIISFTANSGIYSWAVPDDPSDNCLVRISGSDADEGPADQSDSVFSIVSAASVKVISPNGGEQWETGYTYDITWTFTGITGNIVIDLYQGDAFDFNIGTVPVDSGKFAWQIPENFTTGEDYRIFLHKDSVEDYSDSVFSITDQDPNHPDFNNDGKVDILWRNYASGMNEVWYMNGAIKTGTGNLPAMTDLNWQIVGTGDFNGDGKDDILWRNALEGRNQVWFMNGVIVEKYQGLQSLEGQAWQVVGAGDFNSDGKIDILWRNYSTGSNEVWYMDGSSRIGSGLLLEMADVSWQMVGIGDFNLDSETDILWRRYSDGKNMIWYMDGVTRIGYEYIETRSDLNWRIVSNGDYQD